MRQLEKLDILVLNGFESLEMTRDKLQTLQQLAKDQIAIPKTMIARFPIDTSIISRHFSFPIILKKSSGSQGKDLLKDQFAFTIHQIKFTPYIMHMIILTQMQ